MELVGKQVKVIPDMTIFITMNPTHYLKKLFRSMTMTAPESTMIAEVIFFSQGFMSAQKLALEIMPLFRLCDKQLSQQNRYNVTLRELKLSNIFEVGNLAERYQLPG